MPVPVIDPQKRSGAYKKVSPVAGIVEQGLVPDPDVMHTHFSKLFAILGPASAQGAATQALPCGAGRPCGAVEVARR